MIFIKKSSGGGISLGGDNTWTGDNVFQEDVVFAGLLIGPEAGPRLELGDPCGWRYPFDSKFVLSINDRYFQGGISTGHWALRDETSGLSARLSAEDMADSSKTMKFANVAGKLVTLGDPVDPSIDPGVHGQMTTVGGGTAVAMYFDGIGWVQWGVSGP